MSLQGSLDTFALPEVLRLLSTSQKTGELQIKTRRAAGQLWVKNGSLVGGAVGEIRDTVDSVFELLRSEEGSFTFVADRPPARPNDPMDVENVLFEVQDRLTEWREIEAVIPSVAVVLSLVRTIDMDVFFAPDDWAMIAVIGSGTKLGVVMRELELNEFAACKRAKFLVEKGVVAVSAPDGDGDLFHEPETDVSFLGETEVTEEAETEEAGAHAEATEPVADGDNEEAVARWEEIRRLAKIDEDGAEEELTPEEQERAKELIEAEGAEAPEGEQINRGLLLQFLASAQTSA